MLINGVEIDDTFAEAFEMLCARVIITGKNLKWALEAGTKFTGFATSIIGCGCEADIEKLLPQQDTPDGRPGLSILLFTRGKAQMEEQLIKRIGQTILTCPTTACFNGINSEEKIRVGGKIKFFGDGFQISKKLEGRRFWRIPVMEGEFLVEDYFGIQKGVGGGNFFILGKTQNSTLRAAEKAVKKCKSVEGVILPFPGGIVRSGSKVGSKYKFLIASSNTPYCPTIRGVTNSEVPEGVNSVLEIVIDGVSQEAVREAMRLGIKAACTQGIRKISAGNYGGKLGKIKIPLRELLEFG
ncbi:MAG: formylmethanofuran--tetrahydromethanopterin N-formyltransferase [Caldiserica bacterium]|jgi:formylmethanofuran--tetrahydromethanopterin N-formyltransferase|nr:formylmethanofuran--tetrahydromethanopterin N-formyltransferase [Caldisericota bacterium]